MMIWYNFLLAVLSYFIISYLNGLLALNIINPIVNLPTLPDVGFYYLPHISPTYPNLLLLFACIYFTARFFRLENLKPLTYLIWCITILFTIRIFTFTVTIVPPSTIGCINRNSAMPIEWNVLKYLIFSNDNTCTDYMFSGHASYFIILLLFTFQISKYNLEKIVFSIFTLFGLLSIICGHIHYTADVIVAIVLSFCCYNLINYNILLQNVAKPFNSTSQIQDVKKAKRS